MSLVTHRGRVSHIYMHKWSIVGSDNGLLPWRQAIIWTISGSLSADSLGENFSEIWVKTQRFFIKKYAFENVVCKMSVISSRPQCVEDTPCFVLTAELLSFFCKNFWTNYHATRTFTFSRLSILPMYFRVTIRVILNYTGKCIAWIYYEL